MRSMENRLGEVPEFSVKSLIRERMKYDPIWVGSNPLPVNHQFTDWILPDIRNMVREELNNSLDNF